MSGSCLAVSYMGNISYQLIAMRRRASPSVLRRYGHASVPISLMGSNEYVQRMRKQTCFRANFRAALRSLNPRKLEMLSPNGATKWLPTASPTTAKWGRKGCRSLIVCNRTHMHPSHNFSHHTLRAYRSNFLQEPVP